MVDGFLSFWKALCQVYLTTREHRCCVYKTANVLARLPKIQLPKAKEMLHAIWQAPRRQDGYKAVDLKALARIEWLGAPRDVFAGVAYVDGSRRQSPPTISVSPVFDNSAELVLSALNHDSRQWQQSMPGKVAAAARTWCMVGAACRRGSSD
jgi:hypothetical protein